MKFNWKIALFLIVILSSLLRFYKLTEIPASLNPDEKFNGYLSYSLLKTGKDERGNFFPLSIKTFGNWTLPAYSVLTMIPVAILGLNDFSARVVGVVSGVSGTVLIYFVANEMFRKRRMALLAALLYSLSPWNLFLSRISHEVDLAAVFFLAGLLFFLRKKYLASAILFGLTMFTHYAFVIFTPLFLIGLIIIEKRNYWKQKRFVVAGVIFGIFLAVSVITTLMGSAKEISDVGIFGDQNIIYDRVERFLGDGGHQTGDFIKLIHNRYIGTTYQMAQSYMDAFSPVFLFDKGGEKLLHNTGYTGNLYLFEFFLIIIGLATMAWDREKRLGILALWFFLGPLPSMFTKDNPSTTRLFQLMPLFVLFGGYGLYSLGNFITTRQKYIKLALLITTILVVVGSCLYYFDLYFVHLNVQRAEVMFYGYKQAVLVTQKYPNDKIVMVGPDNFPYSAFLFYNQYDPNKFRSEVKYYPEKGNGFQLVQSFGKYEFPFSIDRNKLEPNVLYIDAYHPGDKKTINLPNGVPVFSYYTKSDPWIFCQTKGIGCD